MRTRTQTRTLVQAAVVLATAILVPLSAQQARQTPPPPGTPRNFTLPKPTRFTLPNGLAVTLVPFGQVPKVTLRLVVQAGNLYESADQVWLADLTGRMLQEGTKTRASDAVARDLAGMGGELSVNVGSDTASVGTEVLSERAADAARIVAEVARDVPPLRSVERLLQFVEDILLVFEIGIAKHRLDDEQTVHLARADEGVAIVRPRVIALEAVQVGRFRAKPGGQLRIR